MRCIIYKEAIRAGGGAGDLKATTWVMLRACSEPDSSLESEVSNGDLPAATGHAAAVLPGLQSCVLHESAPDRRA